MSFTYADAISRADGQMEPLWTPGATSQQKLDRLNDVLERFWNEGVWDGLSADLSMTSSSGVITLASGYRKLDALQVSTAGSEQNVPIKSQLWKLTPSANYIGDWTKYGGPMLAFDKGDVSGLRTYQLTGAAAVADSYTYTGQAKLRYVRVIVTTTPVNPDCWPALLVGLRAWHWQDQGDNTRYQLEFADALRQLERDLCGVQDTEDLGTVSLEYSRSGGAIPNIY